MEWMLGLFNGLTDMLNSVPLLSVTASFIWGILSILLSPCHLSGIPLAIGFINGQGKMETKRAFLLSVLFALGILITIAVIGIVTGLLGRMFGDIGKVGGIVVAIILILLGVWMLDIIPLPQISMIQPVFRKKGGLSAFLLGLVFGLALGPCSFGFMMPVLAIGFKTATDNLMLSLAILIAFALGHSLLIVLAGTFTNKVQTYLKWNEKSNGAVLFRRICATLVIVAGIYFLTEQIIR